MKLTAHKLIFYVRNMVALLVLFAAVQTSVAQKQLPASFCISTQEKALFDKINQLRTVNGKKPLKLSASLSYVAKVHVEDLLNNNPDTSVCNLSSWSNKGSWTPCCYNPYILKQECMWDKPKELTTYSSRGYEIAGYFEEEFTPDSVIDLWSKEQEVMDMLLSNNEFRNKEWVCIGVGMNKNYVSVWVGQRADSQLLPKVCENSSEEAIAATMQADTLGKAGYYLIFGSFDNIGDAREAIKKYRKDGFDNAGFLKYGEVTRIYLARFDDLKEAMQVKQKLPYAYREAWIYKE